jgi:fumarate reductase (CoM/CoB) subunit A
MEIVEVDVLIVGGGAAALRAALDAYRAGARVALAVKGRLGVMGQRGAGGTASGAGADRKMFWPVGASGEVLETAYDDIIQLGLGMADPELVRILVDETPLAKRAIQRLGVLFRGRPAFGIAPIMAAAIRQTDCQLYERTMITALLTHDGNCVGAVGINEENGQLIAFQSGAVVLGTGGAAHLFKHNIHPTGITGDGYAIGYRAGADLINLEFMQIFLGMSYPNANNISNWVWSEKFRVYNSNGDEFLANYLPPGASLEEALTQNSWHSSFTTRDSLSRYITIALMKEVMAGRGSPHDGIYMDLTAPGVRAPPERDAWFRYRGVQWDTQPLEVVMFAQSSYGGFRIDRHAQTNVPGLFAAGECAAGSYGADRYGGASMSACQVFGARAGRYAALWATSARHRALDRDALSTEETRIDSLKVTDGHFKPAAIRKELQQAAWNSLLAVRTESGLKLFLKSVEALKEEKCADMAVDGTKELVEALELHNLVLCAEMLGKAALMRRESRGSHYREDYPQQDDSNWLKNIAVKSVDGRMTLDTMVLHPGWRSRPGDMGSKRWAGS